MDKQETLLPCPFCGGTGVGVLWWVECKTCGAFGGYADGTTSGAISAWNTRPASDAKYVPELVRALKYYAKQWPGNDEPNIAQQALANLPEELRK